MAFNLNSFTAELEHEKFGLLNEGNQFSVDITSHINQFNAQWGSRQGYSTASGHGFRQLLSRMVEMDYNISPFYAQELEKEYSHIRFLCQGAQIPSKDISTIDHSHYGPLGKYPYESNHGDIELTFMMTDTLIERLFFEAWIGLVEGPENHSIGWKGDYLANLSIKIFSKKASKGEMIPGAPGYTTRMISEVLVKDAYPISLSAIDLAYDNEGVQTFSVTMTYDQYYFRGSMNDGKTPPNFAKSHKENKEIKNRDQFSGGSTPPDMSYDDFMKGSKRPIDHS